MSLILENAILAADDGLVQSGNKIWFHFEKYSWDLSRSLENQVFGELRRNIEARLEKGLPNPSKAKDLHGTYHLGISPHIYSYYHLLTDLLTHLIDAPKHPVLVPKFMPFSFVNFLTEIGFKVKVLPPEIFCVEKLFVPKIGERDWNKNKIKKIQKFIGKIIPKNFSSTSNNSKLQKKIYVSRKLTKKRHLSNETEFLPILKKYNFCKVYLERLKIQDQIKLFRSASHVIAPHGAGLTNVLFAPCNIKILEIRPVLSSGQFCFENLFSFGWPNYEIIIPPQIGKFFLPIDSLEEILVRWDSK